MPDDFELEEAIAMDRQVTFRLDSRDWHRIVAVVGKTGDKYENESHFIRCAVLRLLKAEELGTWRPQDA